MVPVYTCESLLVFGGQNVTLTSLGLRAVATLTCYIHGHIGTIVDLEELKIN